MTRTINMELKINMLPTPKPKPREPTNRYRDLEAFLDAEMSNCSMTVPSRPSAATVYCWIRTTSRT
jgi:hypothetical protein